jgi:hypothetical protein
MLTLSGEELSVSHQQLQEGVQAADVIIREFSPTGTVRNADLLRDFLSNLTMKLEVRIMSMPSNDDDK